MKGVLQHNDIVVPREKALFSTYKKGDIIVFEGDDGVNVIHMIVNKYRKDGKTYYVTWGVNNQFFKSEHIKSSSLWEKFVRTH